MLIVEIPSGERQARKLVSMQCKSMQVDNVETVVVSQFSLLPVFLPDDAVDLSSSMSPLYIVGKDEVK